MSATASGRIRATSRLDPSSHSVGWVSTAGPDAPTELAIGTSSEFGAGADSDPKQLVAFDQNSCFACDPKFFALGLKLKT